MQPMKTPPRKSFVVLREATCLEVAQCGTFEFWEFPGVGVAITSRDASCVCVAAASKPGCVNWNLAEIWP